MNNKHYLVPLLLLITLASVQLKAKKQERFLFVISAHEYGYFLPELITPLRILSNANIKVDIASPSGNKGRAAASSRLSKEDKQYFKSVDNKLPTLIALADVDTRLYP
jgi:putative intracellular protease/amidase